MILRCGICLYLLLSLISCNNTRRVFLPEELPVMLLGERIDSKGLFTPKKVKVVYFFKSLKSEFSALVVENALIPAIERYKDNPDIVFLIYLSSLDGDFSQEEQYMKDIGFSYPVIYDINKEYVMRNFGKEYNYICHTFDKKNRYVDTYPGAGASFFTIVDKILKE